MMSRRFANFLIAIGFAALTAFACSGSKQTSTTAATPPPPRPPELWGDLKPTVSVKELMRDMIDPASDFVFDAIGTTITKKGRVERMPKTDADWDRIRIGAVTMAEGVYLL